MSIVGMQVLHESLEESHDFGNILSLLNQGVKKALHQSLDESSTRDGMDIALANFEPQTGMLCYAGANRPLWIIKTESFLK